MMPGGYGFGGGFCCQPVNPCCKGYGYALVLVLFILLVIIGAARF